MNEHHAVVDSKPDFPRITAKRYFAMAESGIIAADDRVELLEGLIVSMPPQSPPHASTVHRVQSVLLSKLGSETVVRVQSTFPLDGTTVPEPDVAVVPGKAEDYLDEHPSRALLVVEVAFSSLLQDRMTKAAIYARAEIPCYWIVNLRDHCVEVFREPDPAKAEYRQITRAVGTDRLTIDAFPGVVVEAGELLPPQPSRPEH